MLHLHRVFAGPNRESGEGQATATEALRSRFECVKHSVSALASRVDAWRVPSDHALWIYVLHGVVRVDILA